jgi:hypothetical protein
MKGRFCGLLSEFALRVLLSSARRLLPGAAHSESDYVRSESDYGRRASDWLLFSQLIVHFSNVPLSRHTYLSQTYLPAFRGIHVSREHFLGQGFLAIGLQTT